MKKFKKLTALALALALALSPVSYTHLADVRGLSAQRYLGSAFRCYRPDK